MENASLTISLPRAMKKFIEARVREESFSTPSEYIRSLIRLEQERSSRGELEAFIRGGLRGKALPALDEKGWTAVETILRQQGKAKRTGDHKGPSSRPSKE
jgi:Arc/MetJ-type ribon-helix-helix transcriptional regulator